MEKKKLLYIAISSVLILTGCDDFLDVMPDNRAELDTVDKITALLVSAYSEATDVLMVESASDNVMDNGAKFSYRQEQSQSYLWQDITAVGNDSPQTFWNGCYMAIASANHVLAAIDRMGNTANLQAQRGEALMCRAYGHFALANMFCLPYNPATADRDMGIPYADAPETMVAPKYERGTMEELYKKINADIEEGLPLIDDNIYKVPKYHFNKKAAHAFAARFNLYYHNYEKVTDYADVVLGSSPDKMVRNWGAIDAVSSQRETAVNLYFSASEPANLLIMPTYSIWAYYGGATTLGLRYSHARAIAVRETVSAIATAMWSNSNFYPYRSSWNVGDERTFVNKVGTYFEYTDKVQAIGYVRTLFANFNADETLLCRAEAYALQNKLDEAVADINIWLRSHVATANPTRSRTQIVNFYNDLTYGEIKKVLNPRGFTVAVGEQENIIHCILHLRRIETLHDGLRWQDIKRYGIEISHNREGQTAIELKVDDPRRAMQLPQDVINAGLPANPRN